MKRKPLIALAPLAALTVLASACASGNNGSAAGGSAGTAGGAKITMMVGGLDKIFYMPAELGVRLGFFKKQGLDMNVLNIPAGASQVVDTLLTGKSEVNVSFYDHSVDVQGLGKNIEAVCVLDNQPGEVLLVNKKDAGQIRSLKDLRGKTIGVTSLGGSGEYLTRYLLSHAAGLQKGDFQVVEVGEGSTAVAAMKAGRVDAEVQGDPGATEMVQQGLASVLLDLRTQQGTMTALGGTYPGGAVYASNTYVQAHPDVIQKVVKGFDETLKWMHSHTPQQIAAKMPADYAGGNMNLYVQSIKNSLPMFSSTGVMPAGAPQTVLKVLNVFDTNVQGKNIDLSKTYTNEFAQKAGANAGS